jgi:photosystem II S4 domain protein
MLPREELLKGSRRPEELAALIDLAEEALRTWEPCWSGFVEAELQEEAAERLGALSELQLSSEGGWPQAERRRLLLLRAELAQPAGAAEAEPEAQAALAGLMVSGNFLFDPADPGDVRRGLLAAGIEPGSLGDIWMRGDRGALAVIEREAGQRWDGSRAQVRSVEVELSLLPLAQMPWPAARAPRRLSSVEASLRLDAVASAGLGISRSRMVELIRNGSVRVNWQVVTSPSRELRRSDRVRLDGRGELEILEIQPTKRERWRVAMERR